MLHTQPLNEDQRAGEDLHYQGAEKVDCPACGGSGETSLHAAMYHGEPRCTDCNGKGFDWEPIEDSAPTPIAPQDVS